MKFFTRVLLAAAAVQFVPAAVSACPACIVTDPKNANTYLGMTLMMSILPLGMLGGLIYWFWRRYSQKPDTASPRRPASPSEFLPGMPDSSNYPYKTT
jgi:hypothetical protein